MSRKNLLITIGASVGSAGLASVVTWVVANRRLNAQYEEKLAAEIALSVQYIINKVGAEGVIVTDEDPDVVAERINSEEYPVKVELVEVDGERIFPSEELKPSIEELAARNRATRYDKISTPDVVEEPEQQSLFPENPEPVEEDPDIFVISRDAFMSNESEFEQSQFTYFADGGVMDSQGDFVEDHEKLIGPGTPKFGEESDDANVVYVRNIRDEREFEIISDPGNASDFLMHSLGDMYKPEWAHERKANR